ncbi:MAG: translocation/assembly module TamB domain-containing protein, partial [Propionivibrio sp.]
ELRCRACTLAGAPALAFEVKADGVRSRHRLTARVDLPEKRQLRLTLAGGLDSAAKLAWRGTLEELWLGRGRVALLELKASSPLQAAAANVSFGPATLAGLFGELRIDQLQLAGGGWRSKGRWQKIRPPVILAEFPALAEWRDLLGPQTLTLAGDWDLALAERPSGSVALWREAGDLKLASLELGLGETRVRATLGASGTTVNAQISGARLGQIDARAELAGSRSGALVDPQAPLSGTLQARIPDLAWLASLLGEGWQLAGRVDGEMRFSGSVGKPQFAGTWRGEQLAVRALDQGMRLERGQALVDITPEKLLLRRLVFESELQPLPRLLRLDPNVNVKRLTGTPGRVEASGELSLSGPTAGNAARLRLQLERVGVMQQPDQWIAVSGDGEVNVGEAELVVGGKLNVDAGLWRLADSGRPSLSDDVVIRRVDDQSSAAGPARRALRLDLLVALGKSFHFRGAGVESRLAGEVRIRSDDAGLPRATGTISTADGRFDAYGQKLGIERGIINFQGAIDNPGLNIRAVRRDLPVEAGVEVTGTAQKPVIRLESTPNVPDTEKLSWLVLGRAPDAAGGDDSALLLAAAQTIFGGQGGGFLSELQAGLGIDEFGVRSGQVGASGRQATSQVASTGGFGQSQTVGGQLVSIGKRLSAKALLSYEQSLSTT